MTKMAREEMIAFVGPALESLDDEDIDRLLVEAEAIDARYPDEDSEMLRQVVLGAAVAYLVADLRPDDAGRQLAAARTALTEAMAISQQVAAMAVADGVTEVSAAQMTGIDRMTVRKVLGKR